MTRKPTQFEWEVWFDKPANIGVVTGEISNLAVVDIDDTESWNLLCSVDERFNTNALVIRTGKGYHVYFRPDRNNRTVTFELNNKVHHVKQEGGYVVSPPSKHMSGKTYEFVRYMDPPLWKLDDVFASIQKAGGVFAASAPRGEFKPVNWASELCTKVTPEGGRNTVAAKLCGLLVKKFQYDPALVRGLMLAWNNTYCVPPMETWEIEALIEGEIRRYGPR